MPDFASIIAHARVNIDTGVMNEPMLRAWMADCVEPAPYHDDLPGRWIAEPAQPPPNVAVHRYHLTDTGLHRDSARLRRLRAHDGDSEGREWDCRVSRRPI